MNNKHNGGFCKERGEVAWAGYSVKVQNRGLTYVRGLKGGLQYYEVARRTKNGVLRLVREEITSLGCSLRCLRITSPPPPPTQSTSRGYLHICFLH